ncbi:hypothetical protein [Saccharopolyspora phatthalungensis]|uniref:Uncharacterized protein n=1 Tax=Saccharopolyspora phatthalungensis TaxID=664693 RepID=A0A840QAN9_9PSEU|nr:hypothetical protein [Saccharopolyspora phatthalungensis]MBB5156831.1 hypothetical protein [Saccharopolyspora phatthalungensis]
MAEILNDDVFADLDGIRGIDDLTDQLTAEQITTITRHLHRFGVFFTGPLDLDHAMLIHFWNAYTELDPDGTGLRKQMRRGRLGGCAPS